MVPIRRPWVAASFGLALTLGAASGAVYLVAGALGHPFPLDHRQLHGHTQFFGFAGLLAIGLVEAALPSALGVAPRRIRGPALPLLLAAILLRNLCQPFAPLPVARLGTLLSGALLVAGCLPIFSFVAAVTRESPPRATGGRLALVSRATATYLALAVGVNALEVVWIARGNGPSLPPGLTGAFGDAALPGALLAAGFALGLRLAPAVGRPGPDRRLVSAAVAVQAAGVALSLLSWLPGLAAAAFPLRDTGRLLVAAAVALFLKATGLASGRGTKPLSEPVLRASDTAIRLSFRALALWGLLAAVTVALARLTAISARNPWWEDAHRHLFSVGFVTLLVVGASGRLSTLALGRPLASGALQRGALVLVATGASLRLLQYPALAWPGLYTVGSVMGIPVVAGLVCLARNLALTARAPLGSD